VLFDSAYWNEMLDWIRARLAADSMISPNDVELLHVTDDAAECVRIVLDCYDKRCAEMPHEPEKEDAQ
jgi:predicted Rossmann-fold nucleotide-binding protein